MVHQTLQSFINNSTLHTFFPSSLFKFPGCHENIQWMGLGGNKFSKHAFN